MVNLFKNLHRLYLFSLHDDSLKGLLCNHAPIPVLILYFKTLKELNQLKLFFGIIISSVFALFCRCFLFSFTALLLLSIFLVYFYLFLHQKLLLLLSLKHLTRLKKFLQRLTLGPTHHFPQIKHIGNGSFSELMQSLKVFFFIVEGGVARFIKVI